MTKSFSKILRKKTSIHRKCFFFPERKYFAKNDCTLRSATIIVYIWMHLYLPHFTCSDLGGLWLPSRKKTESSHPGNSFRYHVTFCGSHVVIFVLVWGSAELQISNYYSAENIDKHIFTAQNLILSSDKACPDDQYGQSESGVFHYYSPIRDWLQMFLGWTEIASKFFVVSLKIFRYKSVVILLKSRWQSFLNLSFFRLDDYSTCKTTLV